MKNLKRIFSLALAGTMLAGMLTVGASAATFTDAEDIKNNDAVNFMVALNIINGKDDGSFDPDATVTRAEMAKMITVALNGGVDPVLGTQTTPKFTDIGGHWAQKYIEYCANLGIIGGRGNGTFDPNGTVTGTEAAKMVLVAMGYDSTVFNFTGADWATNVNIEANNATPNKLYKGIETIDPSLGLSRDNAAQIIFNGVQDHIMEKSPSLTITNGEIQYNYNKMDGTYGAEKTLLTEKYGYKVAYGYVTGVSYVEDDDSYDVTLDDAAFNSTIPTNRTVVEDVISFRDDVSNLYGQLAKVVYDEDEKIAVGIYAADSKILASTVVDKIPTSLTTGDTTIKVDGTTYRFDGTNKHAEDVPVFEMLNGDYNSNTKLTGLKAAANKEYAIDLIDNDGNGRINCVVIHPVTVGKVTYLSKTAITISDGVGTKDLEDEINVYEDVKKNDYVIATPAANTVDGKISIVKAETLTGTVGAARASGSDTARTEIRVDGNWYKMATTTLNGHTIPGINDDVDLVLVNGFYAYAEADKTTSKDLLIVTKVGNKNQFEDSYAAKVAFTDGSTATVDVELESTTNAPENAGLTLASTPNVVGVLFTYEKDGDTYVLTKATEDNTGYDDEVATGTFSAKSDRIGNTYIADDAVVFVLYNAADGKTANTDYETMTNINAMRDVEITTGKALKSWSDTYMSGSTENVFAYPVKTGFSDKSNGLDYAEVLVVAFDHKNLPGATGDTKYGYIVSRSYQEKDGSTTWTYFNIWNGSETVSVKEKAAKRYSAGTTISYKDLGGDEVKDVTAISTVGAVTGYSAANETIKILTGGTETALTIDKDSVILYINSKDSEGAENDGIELANQNEFGSYIPNAIYKVGTSNHVDVIFVDINNELDGEAVMAEAATVVTPAAGDKNLAASDFTVDGVFTVAAGTNKGTFTGNYGDITKVMFFRFTSPKAQDYTLTITNVAGTKVYEETAAIADTNAHIFYVDTLAPVGGNWKAAMSTAGAYSFQIVGADGNVVLTGSYQI